MSLNKKLLIVCNTPSANTKVLADAAVSGASHHDIENLDVVFRAALDATADDVLSCNGILIGTTENFGYMAGLIKDFFERIYYPCLEHTEGLPYALYIRAGNDGIGTRTAVTRIITGLRWKAVQEPMILQGDFEQQFIKQVEELGMLMAAGLESDIF